VSSVDPRFSQALELLRSEQHSEALPLFDALIAESPGNAKLLGLRGVTRARSGDAAGAEADLREARKLDPTDIKVAGNLASLLLAGEKRIEALLIAREVLEVDPQDATALSVLERDGQLPPIFQSLVQREPFWSRVGIAIIVLGIAVTVALAVFQPISPPDMSVKEPISTTKPKSDIVSFLVLCAWISSGLASFSWLILDMLNRKARIAWLIPQMVCCFCGLPWFPTAVYFLVGRKSRELKP
jgi:tetratricopeptide (TPR) repeat protein